MSDPDQFGVAVSGGQVAADFLKPQPVPASAEQFQSREWAIDFHEAQVNARITGELPKGWAAVACMWGEDASVWYGMPVPLGGMVCTPPGEGIDGCTNPGFRSLAISVPERMWERGRLLAGVEKECFGAGTVHHFPERLRLSMKRTMQSVRSQLRAAAASPGVPSVAILEAELLITNVVTLAWEGGTVPVGLKDSLRNRARLARRAEHWIREHLRDPIQIPDLCLALGVSRRELEYAFRSVFDLSPRDYVQALRLNAIRRSLLRRRHDAGDVSRIALDHGVTHLSRFAAHYRALFGEYPAETGRRSS